METDVTAVCVEVPPGSSVNANVSNYGGVRMMGGPFCQGPPPPYCPAPPPYMYPPPQPNMMFIPSPPPPAQQIPVPFVMMPQMQPSAPTIPMSAPDQFMSHKILSCVVMWICNCPFGLTAWVLAMIAGSIQYSDPDEARRLGEASMGVAIAGIVVAIIIVALVCGLIFRGNTMYYGN